MDKLHTCSKNCKQMKTICEAAWYRLIRESNSLRLANFALSGQLESAVRQRQEWRTKALEAMNKE